MENKNNTLDQKNPQNVDFIIKTYEHLNEMYKFYIKLRFTILAGSLAVLSLIIKYFAEQNGVINSYGKIMLFLGAGSSVIFFLMDFRTKNLFRDCRQAGKKLEQEHMNVLGFYTYMTDIDKYQKPNKLNDFFSHSRLISSAYFMIFILFVITIIVSFKN